MQRLITHLRTRWRAMHGNGARARLTRAERLLRERHLRDAEERARLWHDLRMLQQQLALARRTDGEHGDD